MQSVIKINKKKINYHLKEFLKIYEERPIKNNKNGMKINHMFALFYLLKKLKPKFIIESGVLKGQSTWLIEKALPNAKLISIDINLNSRIYISKKVKYLDKDFKYFNEKIDPNKTLAFFDDHTCHLERLMQCKNFNIKNIIFEDNYRLKKGDFNSLDLILKKKNFVHKVNPISHLKTLIIFSIEIFKKIFFFNYMIKFDKIHFRLRDRENKDNDLFLKNIKEIFEFPKILDLTTNKVLIKKIKKKYKFEINSYNFLTYITLK